MTKRILIVGSEQATTAMIGTVRKLVERAAAAGHTILTCATDGVCAAVIAACDERGVRVEVYGADHVFRHLTQSGLNVSVPGNPKLRDQYMLLGYTTERGQAVPGCDLCVAIWGGEFTADARYTFQYALRCGKEVWIYARGAQRPDHYQPAPLPQPAPHSVPCLGCSKRAVGTLNPDLCDECARAGRDPRFSNDVVDITALVSGYARV